MVPVGRIRDDPPSEDSVEPSIRDIERRERTRRRVPALIGLTIVVVVGATWFGLFGFIGLNTAYGTVTDVEDAYLCDVAAFDLEFPNLSTLSNVYTADGIKLGQLTERNSLPVPLDQTPELVLAALLSAEDKSFYEHEGIDFTAIGRAVLGRVTGNPAGGGSTITQQVVKQNFLTSDQTIERKICEAVVAAEVERRYTKDQILEFWANSVFFGSNAYGIRAASLEYFGKELDELTIAEAALLPVPIRNPTFYHPRTNPQNALAARNRTIDRMVDNGYILRADGEAAKAEPLGVIPQQRFETTSPQVMIAVRRQLLESPEFSVLGETKEERKRAIFGCPADDTECEGGGGLVIDITLDNDLQKEADRILRAWFRSTTDGPTGAIASVDNDTGAILVLASGVEYGDDIEAGQRPYDLASQGARQPGSAFKPFTLAAALESGDRDGNPVTLGSYWDDSSPAVIECAVPCPPDGTFWTVNNAGGSSGKGLRTLDSATYNSVNTVYARLVNAIGPEAVVEMAHRLGIQSVLQPYLSITLGAQGVSPLEMASAYSTLANFGTRHDPYLVERITDRNGNILYQHRDEPRDVLSAQIAAAVVGSMEKVVSSGTARRADIGRPQAGKTGTATNYRDVWFVGFVPQVTTSVWVGYADRQDPLEDFTVWNDLEGTEQYYRRAFGGTLPAPIWKQFMEYALVGVPPLDFPADPPGTDVYRQTPFTVVPELAPSTNEAIEAIYAAGLAGEIEEVPSTAPAGTLLGTVPLPGTPIRQGSTVAVQVSNGIPPEVLMIDLRGYTPTQVTQRLTELRDEAGISISWSFDEVITTNPAQNGVVVSTSPPPGSPIGPNQAIVVRFGSAP
jgi:membrane peptidoglycan carboxypeptidase